MIWYFLRKALGLTVVVIGVATVLFLMLSVSTDPIKLFVSIDATQEQIEQTREKMGLDDPLPIRIFSTYDSNS
jgi:ABC-type dipeptide/oligopeptide/nickel transport system permease component